MSFLQLPWVEISILAPLLAAVGVRFFRDTEAAGRVALGATLLSLVSTLFAWIALNNGFSGGDCSLCLKYVGRAVFVIDPLSAPLLPLVALLHVLTILSTARVKLNRMSLTGHLVGESLRLALFACLDSWTLIGLVTLSTLPPFLEMKHRGKPTRVYALHMAAFIVLLVGGWAAVEVNLAVGPILLMVAVLVRSGTFPAHLWVADLFENATFGTAHLYVTPIAGLYVALRLVVPHSPPWVLQGIGVASLVTAVYAAGMGTIQTEARRFFAYLFLSHASLVLVGLELHTVTSLTGALCLWVSVVLSLGGLGLTLRAVEARHGRLSLKGYSGLYEQSPALAVGFLLTGLGSVGFPGTMGFVAAELLMDGAIAANRYVGIIMILAATLNGIAVVRVYLLLFTGARYSSSIPLAITARERLAVLVLSALVLGGGLIPQLGVGNRYLAAQHVIDTSPKADAVEE